MVCSVTEPPRSPETDETGDIVVEFGEVVTVLGDSVDIAQIVGVPGEVQELGAAAHLAKYLWSLDICFKTTIIRFLICEPPLFQSICMFSFMSGIIRYAHTRYKYAAG